LNAFQTDDVTLRWHGHSTVSLAMPGTRIYIDPYKLRGRWPDATAVLVTHPHHDHLDPEALKKIDDGDTKLICPQTTPGKKIPYPENRVTGLSPGNTYSFPNRPLTITATHAYNPNRRFHPETNQWLGYVVETEHSQFFHAGDTGAAAVSLPGSMDLALVPVDGIYTMDANTAANWIDNLSATSAAPIHYGTERGSVTDALQFRRSLENTTAINLEKVRLTV